MSNATTIARMMRIHSGGHWLKSRPSNSNLWQKQWEARMAGENPPIIDCWAYRHSALVGMPAKQMFKSISKASIRVPRFIKSRPSKILSQKPGIRYFFQPLNGDRFEVGPPINFIEPITWDAFHRKYHVGIKNIDLHFLYNNAKQNR